METTIWVVDAFMASVTAVVIDAFAIWLKLNLELFNEAANTYSRWKFHDLWLLRRQYYLAWHDSRVHGQLLSVKLLTANDTKIVRAADECELRSGLSLAEVGEALWLWRHAGFEIV